MTFLDHAGNHGLGHDERGYKVYIDHATEIIYSHFLHRDAFDYSGVVHEDVDCADGCLDVGHHGFYGLLVGYVADIPLGVDSESLVGFKTAVDGRLARAVENYFCTCGCECFRYGQADAIGRPGYERYFPFERKLIHHG